VAIDNTYRQWLIDLKQKIRKSQIKAAIKVNTELLRLYWDLGQDIVVRQMETTWGSRFFEQLSEDLRKEFPDMKGFSATNIKYCKRFYLFYIQDSTILQQVVAEIQIAENKDSLIRQQLVGELQIDENKETIIFHQLGEEFENHPIFQIPWRHHVEIFTKCKSIEEALFYVQKTIQNGWSRAVLMMKLFKVERLTFNVYRNENASLVGTKQSRRNIAIDSGLRHRSFLTLRNDVVGLCFSQLLISSIPKKELNNNIKN